MVLKEFQKVHFTQFKLSYSKLALKEQQHEQQLKLSKAGIKEQQDEQVKLSKACIKEQEQKNS